MKATFFFVVNAILFSQSLTAQIERAWVRTYEANAWEDPYAITTDPLGNVYVTGNIYFKGANHDIVTLKYTPSGNLEWAKSYSGTVPGWRQGLCIAFYDGNLYVAGFSGEDIHSGSGHFIVLKYTPAGDTVWTYTDDKAGLGMPYSMKIDQQGNIILAGINGDVFHSKLITMKIDKNGHFLWFRTYDNNGLSHYNVMYDMCIDDHDNIYATGSSSINNELNGYSDIVTIKYNTEGDSLWVKRVNGTGNYSNAGRRIIFDKPGSVYIGGNIGNAPDTYSNFELLKYDTAGTLIWQREYKSIYDTPNLMNGMEIDEAGNIYEEGTSEKAIDAMNKFMEIVKYNSNGDTLWTSNFNLPNAGVAGKMIMDDKANLFIIGNDDIELSGGYNGFACKFDSSGVLKWYDEFDGPLHNTDSFRDFVLDNNNDVIVTGSTYNDTTTGDIVTIKYMNSSLGLDRKANGNPCLRIDCFPNPASGYTTINYYLPVEGEPIIRVLDMLGHPVSALKRGKQTAGNHTFRYNASGLKAGIYFISLELNYQIKTEKFCVAQ